MEEIYYFASPVHVLFPNNILTIKQKQKQKILINQLKYKQHTDDNHAWPFLRPKDAKMC